MPTLLTFLAEGMSGQPLLLNGYAVSGDGACETLTLCASQLLPLQEAVTLDFAADAWTEVSVIALLPQQETVLTALALAWDTDDLPAGGTEGDALPAEDTGTESEGAEIIWVRGRIARARLPVA